MYPALNPDKLSCGSVFFLTRLLINDWSENVRLFLSLSSCSNQYIQGYSFVYLYLALHFSWDLKRLTISFSLYFIFLWRKPRLHWTLGSAVEQKSRAWFTRTLHVWWAAILQNQTGKQGCLCIVFISLFSLPHSASKSCPETKANRHGW